jgi:large subunit ribosomal protein L17
VAALLTNERIRTTDAKAKETRRLAERTITWARRVGDILGKKVERRSAEESARVVHAVRMARRVVRDRYAVTKLFDEIAPRFLSRRGGYTRIVKIGPRPGDAAPMSLLELVTDEVAKEAAKKGADAAAGDKPGKGGDKGKPSAAPAAEAKAQAKGRGSKKKGAEEDAPPAAKKQGGKKPAPKK